MPHQDIESFEGTVTWSWLWELSAKEAKMTTKKSDMSIAMEKIGTSESKITVKIGISLLEQFSQHLYSSPQKAFEELISNSWDACADFVDIQIPEDLTNPKATITVLDNGTSMDAKGLQELWHIAHSPKQDHREQHGRRTVGKFGIGKLSTYVLANHLTYICKAGDGIIRRVTMEYDKIGASGEADGLVEDLDLDLYEVIEEDLEKALLEIPNGKEIYSRLKHLKNGNFHVEEDISDEDDEFCAEKLELNRESSGTWTLAILSSLKEVGRDLKLGILRRMLRAALPLSTEMKIQLNSEMLTSSKIDVEVSRTWNLGPSFPIKKFQRNEDGSDSEPIKIKSSKTPIPHLIIPGIGRVTGTVQLFEGSISGGKSDKRGGSNGFYINVLGRIVNQNDPSFGEKNLSHAAWSRFRMTVRADGLDEYLTINREQFREDSSLKTFRAFLRQAFNLARSSYDEDEGVVLPDGGDILVKSLGALSLTPLRSAVSETLRIGAPPLPNLFDDQGVENREETRKKWNQNTDKSIRKALKTVKFETIQDKSFVKFRISENSIIINKWHPFVAEHSRSKSQRELLRTIGMVNLLSDIYALESGIEPEKLHQVREFRDRLMRFRAYEQRKSGIHIAQILRKTGSTNSKEFEVILADALRYIGWEVEVKGGRGDPDGVAKAFLISNKQFYSFTYDAKSAQSGIAATADLKLDGVNEHKRRYNADHALVVAPGFQDGAAATRAKQLGITLITASDLGKLLEITVELGAIPLGVLKEVFQYHNPREVSQWVAQIEEKLATKRKLTIDVFLQALGTLKGKLPGTFHYSFIAFACKNYLKLDDIDDNDEKDIGAIAKGMSILVPDLIDYDDSTGAVMVNATPERVAKAVGAQIEKLKLNGEGD